MNEREPSLDELIRREREAWRAIEGAELPGASRPPADGASSPDPGLARLHQALAAPRPSPFRRVAAPLVIGAMVVAGWLAFRELGRGPSPQAPGAGAPPSAASPAREHPPGPPATPSGAPSGAATSPDAPAVPSVATRPAVPEPAAPRLATHRDGGAVRAPVPAAQDGLARELALLRDAQLSLGRGDVAQALELAATHAREFPSGILAPERRALERRARCIVDRRALGEPEDTCR